MKHLFLTSSVGTPGVAESIQKRINISKPLKTIFITTPVEPKAEQEDLSWYETDRQALKLAGFDFTDYTLSGKSIEDIRSDLSNVQVIYVSGGNTNYLLKKSQNCHFSQFINQFVNNGGIYIGTSAGSIIAGPELPAYLWGDENEAPDLVDFSGYKLVNLTVIPHWGSPFFRDKYLKGRLKQIYSPSKQPYLLLTDNQYLEVLENQFKIVDVLSEVNLPN